MVIIGGVFKIKMLLVQCIFKKIVWENCEYILFYRNIIFNAIDIYYQLIIKQVFDCFSLVMIYFSYISIFLRKENIIVIFSLKKVVYRK